MFSKKHKKLLKCDGMSGGDDEKEEIYIFSRDQSSSSSSTSHSHNHL